MIIVVIALIIVVGLWLRSCILAPHKRVAHIPGPPPKNVFSGNFDALRNNQVLNTLDLWKQQYGKIHKFMYARVPIIVINDVDAVRDVLVTNSSQFINRSKPVITVRQDSGALLFARDEPWRQMRRIVSPAFNSLHLNNSSTYEIINQCADVLIDILSKSKQKPVAMHTQLQRATLDIIGQIAFRSKFDVMHSEDNTLSNSSRIIFAQGDVANETSLYLAMIPEVLPILQTVLLKNPPAKLKQVFDAVENILRLIDNSKQPSQADTDTQDFLALLDATEGLSKVQKESASLTFLLAGHETTAATLAFAVHLISQHPRVEAAMIEEIDRVLQGRVPTPQDVKNLQYLEWVVEEALRVYCPAPILTREASQDCEILGKFIPAGSFLWIPIYTMHLDKELWGPDAAEFKPERHKNPPSNPQAFLGFGAGPRACIGIRFAMMEAKLLLARLYQKFTFIPSADHSSDMELVIRLTVSPKNDVMVCAIPRTINS